MGKAAQTLMQNLIDLAATNGGLAIIETWKCPQCRQNTFAIHQMREVVRCINCGHRVASGLPRYQKFADSFVEQR